MLGMRDIGRVWVQSREDSAIRKKAKGELENGEGNERFQIADGRFGFPHPYFTRTVQYLTV